jgi:hypothetical protein
MQHKISISPNLKTLEIKPLKNHTNPEHKIPKSKPNSTNFLQNQNPKFEQSNQRVPKTILEAKITSLAPIRKTSLLREFPKAPNFKQSRDH